MDHEQSIRLPPVAHVTAPLEHVANGVHPGNEYRSASKEQYHGPLKAALGPSRILRLSLERTWPAYGRLPMRYPAMLGPEKGQSLS